MCALQAACSSALPAAAAAVRRPAAAARLLAAHSWLPAGCLACIHTVRSRQRQEWWKQQRRQVTAASAHPQQGANEGQTAGSAAPARPPPAPSPYALLLEGKRFKCTECGKCCQGAGEVWANEAELAAMARSLGLSQQHFLSRFTKAYSRKPGWRMLKTQANGDCVFLRDGVKCSIYGVRPLQCSTYPWWPELMEPVAWIAEGVATCEGIEHEEALEVDAPQAAVALRQATLYFADQQAAAHEARGAKRRGGA